MPIKVLNARFETTRADRPGGIKVLNPRLTTLPKPGRNGTGSQFSVNLDKATSNVPTIEGNAFGRNQYRERTAVPIVEKHFGQLANNSIATGRSVAPGYVDTNFPHPNHHFFDVARQVKRPPTQPGSSAENDSQPAGVFKSQPHYDQASSLMPHQRNGIGANQGKNLTKRATYRASAGGANKTLPSDTPFHKQNIKRTSTPATRGDTTKPPDTSSRKHASTGVKVSFNSRQNLWYDPNGSFQAGAPNTQTGRTGTGRWNLIKRGAAG